MTDQPWVITCYGRETGDEYPDAETAKAAAVKHMRACPEGAIGFEIAWHLTDLGDWVSAGGRQWLDHHARRRFEPEDA